MWVSFRCLSGLKGTYARFTFTPGTGRDRIDSSDYSFGYVATWAGGGDQAIAGIKASGERIQKTAATILRAFEPAAEEAAA